MTSYAEENSEGTPLIPKEDMQVVDSTGCAAKLACDPSYSKCGASLACDPRRSVHRYLVLIFMCFLSFGSYFCYDNPAAIQDDMMKDLKINNEQFMLFYSMYSYPNVILSFIGGYLIDKLLGVRLGAIIFAGFILLGQIIFALGAYLNSYFTMCAGRFVFGLGGESLTVAQNTYAVSWFKGKELNMVFGLQLSLARIGSTVNMNAMQPLYDTISSHWNLGENYKTLGAALFVGGVTACVFSLICALILAYFDWRQKKILKEDIGQTGETIKLSDLKSLMLSGKLWLCSAICVLYYVTIFPFIGLGLVFYEMKFDMPHAQASIVNSLVYLLSAGCSPVLGFMIDKTGKNIFWIMVGTIITLGCHSLLAFTFLTPFVAVIFMGIAYSILAASLWPLVAFFIPENQLGTAYGLMQSVQNAGLAAISQASGVIVDSKGYLILIVFYLVCLCLTMIAALVLYMTDAAAGGKLNMSARERKRQAELAKNN